MDQDELDPSVNAMIQLLQLVRSVATVMALVVRVRHDRNFFRNGRSQEVSDFLIARHQGGGDVAVRNEIWQARRHPYCMRLLRDIHQIAFACPHRSPWAYEHMHVATPMVECLAFEGMASSMWLLGKLLTVCDAMNDTVLENPGKYLRYVVRRKLRAEILVAVHLPANVRDQYLAREFDFEVHQVNRGAGDTTRLLKDQATNLLFTAGMLEPPCSACPFCNNRMQLLRTIPQPTLLICEDGYKYARHYHYQCKNEECPAIFCMRSYDSIQYKHATHGDELMHQLDRTIFSLTDFHAQQPRHEKLKYSQVGARVFMEKDMLRKASLRLPKSKASTESMVDEYLGSFRFQPIAQELADLNDPYFLELCRNAQKKDMLRQYFDRGISIFFLEGQWLKTRLGRPFYNIVPDDIVNPRCPEIERDVLANPLIHPLRRFQQTFHGQFQMGEAGSPLSYADDSRKVDFKLAVDTAQMQYLQCLIDASREEAHHYCDDCKQENPETHNVAEVINIDGVSQPVQCCAFGAIEANSCTNSVNARKRFCSEHAAMEGICGVIGCGGNNVGNSRACGQLQHQILYHRWNNSKRSYKQRIKAFLLAQMDSNQPRITINRLVRDIGIPAGVAALLLQDPERFVNANEAVQAEFAEIIVTHAELAIQQDLAPQHRFGRQYSSMEVYIVKSCGHLVARSHMFRAETLDAVLMLLLVATNGGVRGVATHAYYDRACALYYHIGDIVLNRPNFVLRSVTREFNQGHVVQLMHRMEMKVDPFHFQNHTHREYLVQFCGHFCNPNHPTTWASADLFVGGAAGGARLFNSEMQESTAAFIGPFTRVTRCKTMDHAMFFLEVIFVIANEYRFLDKIIDLKNPVYMVEPLVHAQHAAHNIEFAQILMNEANGAPAPAE